jgi:thiol-disulfide isomerase/thioredoxin
MMWILILAGGVFAAEEEAIKTLEIGAAAPDFILPAVDGKNYSLRDFADAKILALIFTCNHCPTANAYQERIMRLVDDYKEKGVRIVAISPNDPLAVRLDELGYTDLNDSFEEMKIRAEYMKYNFTYLYDGETQEMSKKYGPTATPHVFIFDQERKLRYVGRIDNAEREDRVETLDMRNALDALLAGTPVPVETTRVFGCSIKWASKRDSVKQSLEKWAQEEVTLEKINVDQVKELIRNESEKLRVLNIWASSCGPCVAEFPDLITINRMYRHRKFELVTLSADDPDRAGDVLDFLKKKEASCKNYLFDSADVYQLLDAVDKDWAGAIPYTLVIRPGGEVVFKHMGMIDPLKLKRLILEHIPDKWRG